jgi:hypothetical protein
MSEQAQQLFVAALESFEENDVAKAALRVDAKFVEQD